MRAMMTCLPLLPLWMRHCFHRNRLRLGGGVCHNTLSQAFPQVLQLMKVRFTAFLDLTPVDENNATLTDYPVYSLHVDFDGSIRGEAPVGDFLVELVSHSKPMDLASGVIWSITDGGNSFEALQVMVSESYSVSGRVTDQDGDGVWADILFVDPQDEDEITYPSWEPVHMGPEQGEILEGSFSVKVPEGSYKILAREHSGLFEDDYYNGASFAEAQIVVISGDLADVNFTMEDAPFSSITIRLEDNASNPVTGHGSIFSMEMTNSDRCSSLKWRRA